MASASPSPAYPGGRGSTTPPKIISHPTCSSGTSSERGQREGESTASTTACVAEPAGGSASHSIFAEHPSRLARHRSGTRWSRSAGYDASQASLVTIKASPESGAGGRAACTWGCAPRRRKAGGMLFGGRGPPRLAFSNCPPRPVPGRRIASRTCLNSCKLFSTELDPGAKEAAEREEKRRPRGEGLHLIRLPAAEGSPSPG